MEQFTKLTEAEFTKQALKSPAGNFLQTSEMKHLLEKRGRVCEYVGVKRDDQVIAAAILSKMKIKFGYVYEIDGGVLMDYQDQACVTTFFNGLKHHMKKGKSMYFNFTPNLVIRQRDQNGEVIETVNQEIFDYLIAEGFVHQGFDTCNFEGSPRWCFVKDLNGLTESTLFESYGKAAKYGIKKTLEYGITTRELSYEELPLFFKLTEETSQRRGFLNKDLAYYQAVYQEFGAQAKFLVAELNFATYLANLDEKLQHLQAKLNKINEALVENPKSRKRNNQKKEFEDEVKTVRKRIDEVKSYDHEQDTEILAGALFLIHPQEVVYLFSGTYEKYKQYYAPYLLQHEMLTYAISHDISRYNFYGVEGVFDGNDGVLKFKQSFGGTVEELMGTFQWTLQPFKYSLYSFLKKIKENQ